MIRFDFDGKVVVVTGGGSGIGRAIAAGFSAAGASVFVADQSTEAAEDVARSLRAAGGRAEAVTVDVSDEAAVDNMIAATGGRLDVLVCAAGVFVGGTAEELEPAAWRRILDINLTGAFLCARAAIPAMRKQGGGSIVTVSSSTGAHDAIQGAVGYVASKGGVAMLTKALAIDHAAEGIRVNALAPGPTDTPMLRGLMNEADRKAFGATLPIGRLGMPDEFVGAAMFLSSEAASFITGAILPVDGGQTALI